MTATITPADGLNTAPLNALDRCDRCGAQAYVRYQNPGQRLTLGIGEMLLCRHHNNEHASALLAKGWLVAVDETDLLAPTNRQQGKSY